LGARRYLIGGQFGPLGVQSFARCWTPSANSVCERQCGPIDENPGCPIIEGELALQYWQYASAVSTACQPVACLCAADIWRCPAIAKRRFDSRSKSTGQKGVNFAENHVTDGPPQPGVLRRLTFCLPIIRKLVKAERARDATFPAKIGLKKRAPGAQMKPAQPLILCNC
jgi:hypothetical protein